jgi:glycosyltransferase involved in cell wall biosynthesis
MQSDNEKILLMLPVPLYSVGGQYYFERQACNGLRLWLENFGGVVLCAPFRSAVTPPAGFDPLDSVASEGRLTVEPFPGTWHPLAFASALVRNRKRLRRLIDEADYLQFAIGGLWGDWGSAGTLIAKGAGRDCAVWTDRVESEVIRINAQTMPPAKRAYTQFTAWLVHHYERFVIRRSTLGLFHGMDTYTAYSPYSRNPHLVHDIHLGPSDRITVEQLKAKQARPQGTPLKIIYAGRAHFEKGIMDWIDALDRARAIGVSFKASWYGDGPQLEEARSKVQLLGLSDDVLFPGSISDRGWLLGEIKDADLFQFCHLTPESPRCLIEALICGTPIVGYDRPYPADLIARHGGGMLTASEPGALAQSLGKLFADRSELSALQQRAFEDSWDMIDEEVFRHRSHLIKSNLKPRN